VLPPWAKRFGRRLLVGWLFLAVSLAIVGLFPRFELEAYDQVVRSYREIPYKYGWLPSGENGLHKSITLIGDPGSDRDHADHFAVLRRLRLGLAAASSWIHNGKVVVPQDLRNDVLETSPIYVVRSSSDTERPDSSKTPYVVKQGVADGTVRDVYLALKTRQGLTPCLPLLLYARYLEMDECAPEVQGDTLFLGDRALPVLEDNLGYFMALIPYQSQLRAQNRFIEGENQFLTSLVDTMEPLEFEGLKDPKNPLFGSICHRRFFFLGEYSTASAGEKTTILGAFRDFQIAALSLDNLIQGPHLRRFQGPALALWYLLISSTLALWMLSPTTMWGQLVRLALVAAALHIISLALFAAGIYFPKAWLYFYSTMLTGWMILRVWLRTIGYLHRYGGSSAAQLLLQGESDLDHSQVDERTATIVFVGLPDHLRQLEIDDDPRILEDRQFFSEKMARIAKDHQGIVHDFQADFLMLGFGTQPSRRDPNHAIQALRAAHQLIALRPLLDAAWQPASSKGARVQVSVNTGEVAVGWVGTKDFKRASAAIGDTTNVAARLLGTAKKMDLDLIISDTAYELLQNEARFEALPPVKLKGKTEAVAIYKMANPGPEEGP